MTIKERMDILSEYDFSDERFDYDFDHEVSVINLGELSVRWRRRSPQAGESYVDGDITFADRFQFTLSAVHERIYDLYDFDRAFRSALVQTGFTLQSISEDTVQNNRVVIELVAIIQ